MATSLKPLGAVTGGVTRAVALATQKATLSAADNARVGAYRARRNASGLDPAKMGTPTTTGGSRKSSEATTGTDTPPVAISLASIGIGGQKWQVSSRYADTFQAFLEEAAKYGLVESGLTSSGGYNRRKIRRKDGTESPNWSRHAYGEAIDVNALTNGQGTQGTVNPTVARALAAKYGLVWGGDWEGDTRDPMHFEIARGPRTGGAAVDSILEASRHPINFPAPLPASALNPTSEVPMPTLAERMAQARGVYSAPKIGTGAEAIAQLTARKVQSLNQNIAGLDKAVEQARARLLSQGDYAAGRIQAIRARMDPRFAASGAQQAAFGNASAGAIGGMQGALGAGAAADGTGTADLGQAFGENLAATGQLAALDNTFAGAVRGNTNSFLSELGTGTDAITQAGLGSLELNNLEAGTTLRQRSTDALDKETSDITRLYEEARINAELNRPQQEMAALAAINDFYNNQERFGIDRQQLALTQRGQDIGVQQFGVTSGLDARRIANDERSTTANIQQNAAQIGISARNAATSEGQLRLAEREREDKVTESKTNTELVKLQKDPMALGYVPYNKGEKDRYPLMPSVAGDIWKLNRDGIDFVSTLPPEGRTFTAQKALDASKSLDNAVLHPETLAGWASVQDVTTEGQVKAEAQKYYREVALSQMPGSYKGDPTATKNFVKQFTDTNVEETVKYWRLATASSLTGSEKQPVSFSANEKAYINKYLSEMSADRSIQQNVAGGLGGLTAAGGLATAGAKNAKINPSLPISPAVRAAVHGVRGPRV